MIVPIYGGGTVGLGIVSCLLKAEQEINIIAREEIATQLKFDGFVRTGIFGNALAEAGSNGVATSLRELGGM